MATILDVGLLGSFSVIFPVLFVFSLVFAILQKTKALGENSVAINGMVAVAASLLLAISQVALDILNIAIPWFAVFIVIIILVLLTFQVFGVTDDHVIGFMGKDRTIGWTLIGIAILIVVGSVATVFGQQFTDAAFKAGELDGSDVASSDFETSTLATLFHPKVLGAIVILSVLFFAVIFLTATPLPPPWTK